MLPLRLHVSDALWTLEHRVFVVGGKLGPQHTGLMLANTDYTVLTLRFASLGGGKIVSYPDATAGPCNPSIGPCTGIGPPPDPAYTPADRTVTLFCKTARLAVNPQQLTLKASRAADPPFGPIEVHPSADAALDGVVGRVLDRRQVYWLLEVVQAQIWRGNPAA